MSCPILSSTARRLSRPRRTVISAFSSSRPVTSLSSSFCDSLLFPARLQSKTTQTPRDTLASSSASLFCAPSQRRVFSSSPIRRATKTTLNPRTGEDGNTLMVNISPRAAERLREITDPSSSPSPTKEENPYHHLRITVTSGGCHGFQYMMSLEAASKIDPEDDTVFEAEYSHEEVAASGAGEAKVVMDEPSLELLSGSTVDYTMELIGSQFKIIDNPRATSNCGCGTSFDVSD
ncbi:HesB/IscA family protein [Aspergillus tanneri]|uniref:Core domain-containing protein n=2 Tax=Aspergillus tanneri TaxID=1220188 RepID=A0A5M9MTV4_9EURO|nr:uncharacterized protein ATNIH1004_003239 [Aspergillus tanneri]KAA8650552.1 hypothetical protein ATNIH1004_003239 [Aspergillus tanneri]